MTSLATPHIESMILDVPMYTMLHKIQIWLGGKLAQRGVIISQLLKDKNWRIVSLRKEGNGVLAECKREIDKNPPFISYQGASFRSDNFESVLAMFMNLGFIPFLTPIIKSRVWFVIPWSVVDNHSVSLNFDTFTNLCSGNTPTILKIKTSTQERLVQIIEYLNLNRSHLREFDLMNIILHYYPNSDVA